MNGPACRANCVEDRRHWFFWQPKDDLGMPQGKLRLVSKFVRDGKMLLVPRRFSDCPCGCGGIVAEPGPEMDSIGG